MLVQFCFSCPATQKRQVNLQTLTPAPLQMSAKASSASLLESPQNFWIVCAAFFSLHTAFMSDGLSYVLTAPRRQPGGDATAKEARAKKVVVKRVRASIVTKFRGLIDWLDLRVKMRAVELKNVESKE
jgi:hypothetical protein